MLSKYHPIGIMVYGSADLMGVPWESIVKIYRKELAENRFDALREYTNNFLQFLDNNTIIFPESIQRDFVDSCIKNEFKQIFSKIDESFKAIFKSKGKLEDLEISKTVDEAITDRHKLWEDAHDLETLPSEHVQELVKTYKDVINDLKKEVFGKLPISESSSLLLDQIIENMFTKKGLMSNYSGIVIAGFGEKETFPSISSLTVEYIANNRLVYYENDQDSIDFTKTSIIMPFAQKDEVITFMEGIHPSYRMALDSYFTELFSELPKDIVDTLGISEKKIKRQLENKLRRFLSDVGKDLGHEVQRNTADHVQPILQSVRILPKDELAAMAESLINLTKFKQRVSTDAETVGGEIDVAVISKGDGFVWIKRKHYFKQDLNPHYFQRYYQKIHND